METGHGTGDTETSVRQAIAENTRTGNVRSIKGSAVGTKRSQPPLNLDHLAGGKAQPIVRAQSSPQSRMPVRKVDSCVGQ